MLCTHAGSRRWSISSAIAMEGSFSTLLLYVLCSKRVGAKMPFQTISALCVSVRSALDSDGCAVRWSAIPHTRGRFACKVCSHPSVSRHPFVSQSVVCQCSRVGVSLLSNIDMQELIAFSRKEYEDMAGKTVCALLTLRLQIDLIRYANSVCSNA